MEEVCVFPSSKTLRSSLNNLHKSVDTLNITVDDCFRVVGTCAWTWVTTLKIDCLVRKRIKASVVTPVKFIESLKRIQTNDVVRIGILKNKVVVQVESPDGITVTNEIETAASIDDNMRQLIQKEDLVAFGNFQKKALLTTLCQADKCGEANVQLSFAAGTMHVAYGATTMTMRNAQIDKTVAALSFNVKRVAHAVRYVTRDTHLRIGVTKKGHHLLISQITDDSDFAFHVFAWVASDKRTRPTHN